MPQLNYVALATHGALNQALHDVSHKLGHPFTMSPHQCMAVVWAAAMRQQPDGCALTLPVPLTHISPDGQHLSTRVRTLQSSPQHTGTKLVVALLMQRLEGQQPSTPQHTCTCQQQRNGNTRLVRFAGLRCMWPAGGSPPVPGNQMNSGHLEACMWGHHSQQCCQAVQQLYTWLIETCLYVRLHVLLNVCHRQCTCLLGCWLKSRQEILITWPFPQQTGGSNGLLGMAQNSHSDLGTSG
jgi:hypothetical protein